MSAIAGKINEWIKKWSRRKRDKACGDSIEAKDSCA